MGSGAGHTYKTIEEKVRFHQRRAKHHLERAKEWERILSEIQQLQRLDQASSDKELGKVVRSRTTELGRGRNDFARDLLKQFAKSGITPAEIRQHANEAGHSIPTNYPYKLFRTMRLAGKLRKDEEGRYFLVGN